MTSNSSREAEKDAREFEEARRQPYAVVAEVDDTETMIARCEICNVQTPLANAVETGWAPEHYVGDDLHGPVCPQCQQTHCRFNEEMGDYERVR